MYRHSVSNGSLDACNAAIFINHHLLPWMLKPRVRFQYPRFSTTDVSLSWHRLYLICFFSGDQPAARVPFVARQAYTIGTEARGGGGGGGGEEGGEGAGGGA